MKTVINSVLICLIIGGLAAGLYATRNANTAAATSRLLVASMINPSDAISSPRTYNQTLVETIDTDNLVTSLQMLDFPVTSIAFDVLPDSFHIQVTVTLSKAIDDETNTSLANSITLTLDNASSDLAEALFAQNTPRPVAVIDLTKVLPAEASIQQSPLAAALYGAIAGALFGWFVGLTIADRRKSSEKI